MTATAACHSCGAKLPIGAERCDLCGTSINDPLDDDESAARSVIVEEAVAERTSGSAVISSTEPVACGTCGHVNPARSKFCNQCGTFVHGGDTSTDATSRERPAQKAKIIAEHVVHAETIEPVERPTSEVGRKALGMVGIGIGVVAVLYALTVFSSRDSTPATSPDAQPNAAASTSGGELPDSLQSVATALEAEGSASSWARLGHLYFSTAMRSSEAARAELATRAVDAFDLSLAIEENADVRTSLAEAAQFDQRNPMRAVQELQAVLATTPDHVAANYLLGALRARIGRLDGAAESFQRVIDLTPTDDPIHQRAVDDLAAVQQTMASSPSGQ